MVIELVLAWIFMVITIVFLFVSAGFLYFNYEELGNKQIKMRYGPLYEELDIKKKWNIIAFRTVFLIRRIVIIVALLATNSLWK